MDTASKCVPSESYRSQPHVSSITLCNTWKMPYSFDMILHSDLPLQVLPLIAVQFCLAEVLTTAAL